MEHLINSLEDVQKRTNELKKNGAGPNVGSKANDAKEGSTTEIADGE